VLIQIMLLHDTRYMQRDFIARHSSVLGKKKKRKITVSTSMSSYGKMT
jgi:hypothetical protein